MSLNRFVAFSDHHAHEFRYASRRVKHPTLGGMYNSRLLDGCRVLGEIRAYCNKHKITKALFGGDLFHKRTVISTAAWNVVQHELAAFVADGIKLLMIPGNHDYADRAGFIHSLRAFDNVGVCVADKVRVERVEGLPVITVPYTDDINVARRNLEAAAELGHKNQGSILLAHLGMQGARVGSDYILVSDSDIKVKDVDQEAFTLCLFGHYHQHQRLFRNGYFIGATHQHNWGDANTSRGFLDITVDGQDFSITHVETTAAPKFYKLDATSTTKPRPLDFVKYQLSAGEKPTDVSFDVASCDLLDVQEKEVDIELPDDYLDPVTLLPAWVDINNKKDEAYAEALKALGTKLLAQAERENL